MQKEKIKLKQKGQKQNPDTKKKQNTKPKQKVPKRIQNIKSQKLPLHKNLM